MGAVMEGSATTNPPLIQHQLSAMAELGGAGGSLQMGGGMPAAIMPEQVFESNRCMVYT